MLRRASGRRKADPASKKGDVIGQGEQGVVYKHVENDAWVIKVVHDRAAIQGEVAMQRRMACIGVAPRIIDVTDNEVTMERIVPLRKNEIISIREQEQLVNLVLQSVAVGLLHNDLHQGNIGRSFSSGNMVMFDFGFTTMFNAPDELEESVYLQIVAAQLYALLDPCNTNNSTGWLCDPKSPVVNAIYTIRNRMDTNALRKYAKIRSAALQKLHCLSE